MISSTTLEAGELPLPVVAAGAKSVLAIPAELSAYKQHGQEVFLTIRLSLAKDTAWAQAGHEVAWFQHKVSSAEYKSSASSTERAVSKFEIEDSRTKLKVTSPGGSFTFDRVHGYLTSWTSGQDSGAVLEEDPQTHAAIFPNFWRAPTDNDKGGEALTGWLRQRVNAITSQVRSFSFKEQEGGVMVETDTYLAPPVLGWGFNIHTTYTITPQGALDLKYTLKTSGEGPRDIPRVGLNLRLPKSLAQASWFGLGPGESYPDKKTAQRAGIWSSSVDNLEVPYDVPQDNGNRMETRWVRLAEKEGGAGVLVTRRDQSTFSWQGGRLSVDAIESAKHPCDLVRADATLLHLSAKVAGVGSAACGPDVREDLKVKFEDTEFEFLLEKLSA